jgi:recombination protein RecA
MKIGVMFGNPETTSGGRALKFYSSVRMDIRRIGAVKDGNDVIGNKTRVKIKKNKVAPPFKEAEFDIIYGEGISSLGELIDLGTEYDILDKSGSWYSYEGETIAQGRANTKEWLRENPEARQEIKLGIRKELGMVSDEELEDADESEAEDEEADAEETEPAAEEA